MSLKLLKRKQEDTAKKIEKLSAKVARGAAPTHISARLSKAVAKKAKIKAAIKAIS